MEKTLNEYISENGYSIQDFNAEEIEELKKEVCQINEGKLILDGLFSMKERPNYGAE